MKLSSLKTIDQVIEDRRNADPDFAAEWDRATFARQVAITVIRYRNQNRLTQRQLATQLGFQQPAIARLERGEENPSLHTLVRLSKATGLQFHVKIADGDVAIPPPAQLATAEYQVSGSFRVRHQDGRKLDPAELDEQQIVLLAELRKLEHCNTEMSDPDVHTAQADSKVTLSMTILGKSESDALQAVSHICRTAIHAVGGSTPDWETPGGSEPYADFEPAGFQIEFV